MKTTSSEWLRLSGHALDRMRERRISWGMVEAAWRYGRWEGRRGNRHYRVTELALRGTPHEGEIDRLRGLCVVVSRDGTVVTVMRTPEAGWGPGRRWGMAQN